LCYDLLRFSPCFEICAFACEGLSADSLPPPIQSCNSLSSPPLPLCHCAVHLHLPPLRVAGWGLGHPPYSLPKPWVALCYTALTVVWYLGNPRHSVCRVPTSGFSKRRTLPVLDMTINRFNLVKFQLGAIFNLVNFQLGAILVKFTHGLGLERIQCRSQPFAALCSFLNKI
jgi:hypothetical protein